LRIRVLVDQAAEALASVDNGVFDRWLRCDPAGRRGLVQEAVWPVAVVMVDEDGQNVVELPLVDDQDSVQQLAA
jgi:hypothetical protein